MKLEILLSTMNRNGAKENVELLNTMNAKINSLTINQITKKEIKKENDMNSKNRLISVNEKGLSKSRNMAIKNAKGDVCIFADDDVKYVDDFQKIIENEYNKNKKYDIICFWVESDNKNRRIKRMITSPIGKMRAMRICSFQITFKRERIIEKNMLFNENFGAGTDCDRGEETIFLWECIRKGLKIKFVNKKIAEVSQGESTWFKGFTEDYFIKQGQVFYELSNKFYKFLILQFTIRKYHLYRKNIGLFKAIKLMLPKNNNRRGNSEI